MATERQTDYDRACAVTGYVGTVQVARAEGLVLGEPMQTAWFPREGSADGALVQWLYAGSESSVILWMDVMPRNLPEPTPHRIRVSERAYCLFDSAIPGRSLEGENCLSIQLHPGTYRIELADYRPDTETALVVVRLAYLSLRKRPSGRASRPIDGG